MALLIFSCLPSLPLPPGGNLPHPSSLSLSPGESQSSLTSLPSDIRICAVFLLRLSRFSIFGGLFALLRYISRFYFGYSLMARKNRDCPFLPNIGFKLGNNKIKRKRRGDSVKNMTAGVQFRTGCWLKSQALLAYTTHNINGIRGVRLTISSGLSWINL